MVAADRPQPTGCITSSTIVDEHSIWLGLKQSAYSVEAIRRRTPCRSLPHDHGQADEPGIMGG